MSLVDSHNSLFSRFATLRKVRGQRPVYALEHGFEAQQLEELTQQVSNRLLQIGLGARSWSDQFLPLIVVATEVGYKYEGTGTVFWPRLNDWLKFSFEDYERKMLSRLFERAHAELGIVRPPDTAFTRAFRHIAWPITNAIIPRELFLPLTRCLSRLRRRIEPSTPAADVASSVRTVAIDTAGTRLQQWLADTETSAAVIRAFLGLEYDASISADALLRITADLEKNHEATANRSRALANQKRLADNVRPFARVGRLLLSQNSGRLTLLVKLPPLDPAVYDRARDACQQIRWRPSLWGRTRPLHRESVLNAQPFAIDIDALPLPEEKLLPGLDAIDDLLVRRHLESRSIDTTRPLIFLVDRDSDTASQILNRTIDEGTIVWILLPLAERPPAPATTVGSVAGARVWRIDSRESNLRRWLHENGILVSKEFSVRWIGAAPLNPSSIIPEHVQGDLIALSVPKAAPMSEVAVRFDLSSGDSGPAGTFRPGEVASISDVPTGLLRARLQTDRDARSLDLMAYETWSPLPLVTVTLEAERLTPSSLATGELTWRVQSSWELQGLPIRLSLRSATKLLGVAEMIAADLPLTLTVSNAWWHAHGRPSNAIEQVGDLDIVHVCLDVAGGEIASEKWALTRVHGTIDWREVGDSWVPFDDDTPTNYVLLTAKSPVESSNSVTLPNDTFALLQPSKEDAWLLGEALCVGPSKFDWEGLSDRKLLRVHKDSHGGLGIMSVARAYLAWATSQGSNIIAETFRLRTAHSLADWLVEQLCGRRWREIEERTRGSAERDFWDAFLQRCQTAGLGFGVVPLKAQEVALYLSEVRRVLQSRLGVWWSDSDDESMRIGEACDLAFLDAYATIATRLSEEGFPATFDPDEIDFSYPPEQWLALLGKARAAVELPELADLLLPPRGADSLREADWSTLNTNDVVEFLADWVRRHAKNRSWDREAIECAFLIWARPTALLRFGWREIIAKLAEDTFIARAFRYAALRYSIASRTHSS